MKTGRCALVALLGAVALHGARADCYDTNLQLRIDSGSWYEYCCVQMDGTQDVSYYANFQSVNNDDYTTQSIVADDSGNTGHCADSAGGPPGWKYYTQRPYQGNFDNTEQYIDPSAGTYIHTQINFRVYCNNPGSGSQCQIQIEELRQCNGQSCGAANGATRNNATAAPRHPGPGDGRMMPSGLAMVI